MVVILEAKPCSASIEALPGVLGNRGTWQLFLGDRGTQEKNFKEQRNKGYNFGELGNILYVKNLSI